VSADYRGYLAPHLASIIEMHGRGMTTREIAQAIYAAGARANPYGEQLPALQGMVAYLLHRHGLLLDTRKRDELKQARADFMLARREEGATYKQIAEEFGVSLERARQVVIRAGRRRDHGWSQQLSMRLVNVLRNMLGDGFLEWSEREAAVELAKRIQRSDLLAQNNFGKKSLLEFEHWLARFGQKLTAGEIAGSEIERSEIER
jgi:hypothetical protein